MMYSNARYGNYKQAGTKNRGYMDEADFDFEIPRYEEMHFMTLEELVVPQAAGKKSASRR